MKSEDFSLELVRADTKEPMKEFTAPDGKVFVQAEPDLEYFIRCHRENGDRQIIRKSDTTVELRVDGQYIGYDCYFSTKPKRDLGRRVKSQNGVDTYRPLKLILKERGRSGSADAQPSENATLPSIGRVKAKFFETLYFDDMEELEEFDETEYWERIQAATLNAASGSEKEFATITDLLP